MKSRYVPQLDGIRALACLAVVAFHAHTPLGHQGYVGVDVFFVLSGYLITTVLLTEHERTGGIAVRRFYVRRFFRLYPALFVLSVAVLVFCAFQPLDHVLLASLVAVTYTANFWRDTGHDPVALGHTWTLAIEEHFYLVWPPILVLARRWRRAVVLWTTVAVMLGLAFVPLSGSALAVQIGYRHAMGLPLGCALALLLNGRSWRPGRPARLIAACCGVALITIGFGSTSISDRWLDGWFRPAIFLAAPVIAVAATGGFRVLGRFGLPWIGRRSYSLYLWHLPVFWGTYTVADKLGVEKTWPIALGTLAVSVLAADLSYRIVERPVLAWRDRDFVPDLRRPGELDGSSDRRLDVATREPEPEPESESLQIPAENETASGAYLQS